MKTCSLLLAVMIILSCSKSGNEPNNEPLTIAGLTLKDPQHVQAQLEKYSPTEISYDRTVLDETQNMVLDKLIEAAGYMDEIFLRQVYGRNIEIRDKLRKSSLPEAEWYLRYFVINFGPFDRLEDDEPFIGETPKPAGAAYYPEDMTKEEFDTWLINHPEDREAFESSFTVIRRKGDQLIAVPYSEEYREFLEPAAALLREAADLTTNMTLRKYLETRAAAFLSNDYFESDMAWMELEGNLVDPTIGPYEVYEDGLMGYKAAFESFITLRDLEESAKFAEFGTYLPELEMNLPIDEVYKNTKRGLSSPTSVATEVFTAGDTKAGVQTIAFNLPNDERVREAKGSKKVMLKNVIRAKFDNILMPIAGEVLADSFVEFVNFDSYFYETYMHEMAHGLGPGRIIVDGRETTVNRELKEHYSAIEEAKADIVGLLNVFYFHRKGLLPLDTQQTLSTFLAGIFRAIRFGVSEAHGKANLIELNYLLEKGCISQDPETLEFSIDVVSAQDGIRDLAKDLLMLEALGDYDAASRFIERYGQLGEATQQVLDRLTKIPVDIVPVFTSKYSE